MAYVAGIFGRFQMASERLGAVPVTSGEGSQNERADILAQYDGLFIKFTI